LGTLDVQEKLREKLAKLRHRGYLRGGHARSFLNYFAVPKGDNDIRAVFDGTRSGLNDVLYAPWFGLPTVDSLTRCLDVGYHCADNDVGEQFYNFWLHPELQLYSGVDLTTLFPGERSSTSASLLVAVWNRCVMGQKPSPYQAVRDTRRAKFITMGDSADPTNIFGWATVQLNLPGSAAYRPDQPWISKRTADGFIAAEVLDYVDDNRTTGHDEETAWLASSHLAKNYSFLGIQDATRKRRFATTSPGPWAGVVVVTVPNRVYVSVTAERWLKTKAKIAEIRSQLTEHIRLGSASSGLSHKVLESCRGFLVYVSRAFSSLKPYLKGLHLTIDGWRPDRDDQGWRSIRLKEEWLDENEDATLGDVSAPLFVLPVPRLEGDLRVLEELTAVNDPPQRPVRPKKCAVAHYGFGDASGAGFGMAVWDPEGGTDAQYGLWTELISSKPSNYREALNIVSKLEQMVESGDLHDGVELFLFTDNFTTESVFYRGDARSPDLFNLVLRLRKLEMLHGMFIHVIWISGKRMIAQGVDGLSRGDLTMGVMAGESMLSFVPLHLSCDDRVRGISTLLVSTLLPEPDSTEWRQLDAGQWFTLPFHQDGHFVWTPPPAVADVAVERLAEAFHIRPWNTHVIVVPTLMTQRWRRQLSKAADLVLTLPFDDELWPECAQFERLTFAVICPLLRCSPWRVKLTDCREDLSHDLQGVSEPCLSHVRSCVRKFWVQARSLEPMHGGLARNMLHRPGGGPVPHGIEASSYGAPLR
jgi:hypothetical protein